MAGFTAHGPSWYVEDLSDERYPVFVLWDERGRLVLGAAGMDNIDDLIETKAVDVVKRTAPGYMEPVVRFRIGKINPPLRATLLRGSLSLLEVKLHLVGGIWCVKSMRQRKAR